MSIAILFLSTPIFAQQHYPVTQSLALAEIKTGSLFFEKPQGYQLALIQHSDYQVEVNGLLARVVLTQRFINNSKTPLEAIYVFPLIDDAAVDAMQMKIGERTIIGEIKEKKLAKKLYQQAKQQGKKASLLSQQRPNIFTTKVSAVAPGETVKITLSYLQSIQYHDDEFSLRIPLTITPRYTPEPPSIREHSENSALSTPELHNTIINNVTKISDFGWANLTSSPLLGVDGQKADINVKLNSGLQLTHIVSRYHPITKQQQGKITQVSLANTTVAMDRDYLLSWQVAQGNNPKAAFFQTVDERYHYGLLMVMPPKARSAQVIQKEVIYIIDTSGSMGGVAIEQAKQALTTALTLLKPEDTFNIIAFNNQAQRFFPASQIATPQNINLATYKIGKLQAGGGTNMMPALVQALLSDENSVNNSYRQVVFITDGAVTNEDELFTLIDTHVDKTRLHTIGIGSAPNSYFMSRAAELGRGTYRYIGDINEVRLQVQQLLVEISQPMMRDIKINWPMANVEFYPAQLPDLYQHQPLLISARWPKTAAEEDKKMLTLTGQLADNQWYQQLEASPMSMHSKSRDAVNLGIDQWWARQKIKQLSQRYRRSDEQTKAQLQQLITQLALSHHIVTAYTSFVAVEQQVSAHHQNKLPAHAIAHLAPKGSTQQLPFANTALGLANSVYWGGLFLLLGMSFAVLAFRSNSKARC